MAENSNIQWTHHTFNPWSGCSKVHEGCKRCYAEVLPPSMRRHAEWGEVWQGGTRVVAAKEYWRQPYAWARAAARAGARNRVFCASTSDVLEVPACPSAWPSTWDDARCDEAARKVWSTANVLDKARARLWDVIRDTSSVKEDRGLLFGHGPWGLDWLLLTKRPENWRLVPEDVRPLVWLGTSVSDQETVTAWVPRLIVAEGFRMRFLSVEPLVGPVDLWAFLPPDWDPHDGIDWVIVGGESGPGARPLNLDWMRSIIEQCREAGVPCFVKQLGAVWARDNDARLPDGKRDTHGGNPDNWPEDLRVQEFPEVRHA